MRNLIKVFLLVACAQMASLAIANASTQSLAEATAPKVVLIGVPFEVSLPASPNLASGTDLTLHVGDQTFLAAWQEDRAVFADVKTASSDGQIKITTSDGSLIATTSVPVLPGWAALIPSVLAITMALLLRQVIPALALSVWAAASLVHGVSLKSLWLGFLDMPTIYVLEALTDSGHMSILLFSMMIAGMVGIISKNGGMAGIVVRVSSLANTAQHGQLSTALMGTVIFFDDYANTLVVGNTMRPITDKLKISRQKLAYIVDSTAAPVASIALITTWIGFEVGLIDKAISSLEGLHQSAYSIFLSSLPFGFYSIFALAFVYFVALTGRDFGPMAAAEERARNSTAVSTFAGSESDAEDTNLTALPTAPPRSINAIVPLAILIGGTFLGIYVTGSAEAAPDAGFRDIIGAGDSYKAMVWASTGAVIVALILTLSQRLLSLGQALDAWIGGVKYMTIAIIILTLAWSLAGANEALHTAEYLASTLSGALVPALLPTLVFILAAMMAFATGTSWGVMGIMIPLVIPLTWSVLLADPSASADSQMYVLYSVVAALLSGSVWGDHCSPISDTTILSSMASDCDHIEHVRTQLPYAVFVALVALAVGTIPSGYGVSPAISLPAGLAILLLGLFVFGRKIESVIPKN